MAGPRVRSRLEHFLLYRTLVTHPIYQAAESHRGYGPGEGDADVGPRCCGRSTGLVCARKRAAVRGQHAYAGVRMKRAASFARERGQRLFVLLEALRETERQIA